MLTAREVRLSRKLFGHQAAALLAELAVRRPSFGVDIRTHCGRVAEVTLIYKGAALFLVCPSGRLEIAGTSDRARAMNFCRIPSWLARQLDRLESRLVGPRAQPQHIGAWREEFLSPVE